MIVWLAIGVALAAIAATAPLRWAAAVVVLCLPLAGTAVFMLGREPLILPLVVALGFLARHGLALLNGRLREQFMGLAQSDLLLIGFAFYCVVSGLLFPRVFEGATQIVSQLGMIETLGPAQISYAQIAYLVLGVWVYLALRHAMLRKGLEFITAAILVQIAFIGGLAFVQAGLGFAQVQLPTDWIVNYSGYALMTNTVERGSVRITSVFVEASVYAAWATGALAFCYALYLNRIFPVFAIILTGMVGVTMLLSTSSTAYFGLLVIAVLAFLHAVLDSDRTRRDRGVVVLLFGAFAVIAAMLVILSAQDGVLRDLRVMIEDLTINKAASSSAVEHGNWSASSLLNAWETGLLGTGYGSARSSGLIFQLIGTVGVPGLLLFVVAMGGLGLRAFRRPRSGEDAVVSAGAFGLIAGLGAMAVSGSDLALANMFWVYAALAAAPVAQRAANRAARQRAEAQPMETAPPEVAAGSA